MKRGPLSRDANNCLKRRALWISNFRTAAVWFLIECVVLYMSYLHALVDVSGVFSSYVYAVLSNYVFAMLSNYVYAMLCNYACAVLSSHVCAVFNSYVYAVLDDYVYAVLRNYVYTMLCNYVLRSVKYLCLYSVE